MARLSVHFSIKNPCFLRFSGNLAFWRVPADGLPPRLSRTAVYAAKLPFFPPRLGREKDKKMPKNVKPVVDGIANLAS
jgi:hypothetical protein